MWQVPCANHDIWSGILEDMNGTREIVWQYLRGCLPYPDLLRRARVRRGAGKLVTCKQWPGDQATGMDAAQLALLRLLYLQQLTRTAVSERRAEDAALLAMASIETAIVGLYCLHSGDAIADLSAAALGELGPDLNVRDLVGWLEREQELVQAATLYHLYYLPLSQMFSRAYAFALMRHVNRDGSLRRRPAFQWTRCSAARLADGCAGLLAANIADVSGDPTESFLRYATAHFDRALTPEFTFAVKGALRAGPLRAFPAALTALAETRAYAAGPSQSDGAGQQDPGEHGAYGEFAGTFDDPHPDGQWTSPSIPPSDEVAGMVAWNDDLDADRQARHRRPYSG
jgi:hypothetical protein